MIQKRKLLAIFMAAAMAWQGFSLAQAEEIGPGVVSQSNISNSSENSGVPSEEDIRAAQAKTEEEKAEQAGAQQNLALTPLEVMTTESSKVILLNPISASYTNKEGTAPYDGAGLSNNGEFGIQMEFAIPNDAQVKTGDTSSINMPASFTALSAKDFEVRDGENLLAKAHYSPDSNAISLTYEPYVEQKSDIRMSLFLSMQVNRNTEAVARNITTEIRVNNYLSFPIAGSIQYTGIEKETDFKFVKDAKQSLEEATDPLTGNKIYLTRYRILINLGEARTNLVLRDSLGEGAFSYYADDAHPISIRKGVWERGHFEGRSWISDPINGSNFDLRTQSRTNSAAHETAAESAFRTNAPGRKSFSVNLGNIDRTEGFEIFYYAKFDGVPLQNFTYTNTAELISNGFEPLGRSFDLTVQKALGTASGDNYKIKIKKVNEDNQPLSGAVFAVANSSGQQVGQLTTDANGDAILDNLVRDNYTVQEIQAPVGYILSTEQYQLNVDSFDLSKQASLRVENVKSGQNRSIGISTKWVDAGNQAQGRPGKVVVELLRNGSFTGDAVELTQGSGWKASFQNLPKYDSNGKLYEYSIREQAPAGYYPTVSGSQDLGFNLVNTVNSKVSIPVTAVWKRKGENPSSVTVRLMANDKEIASQKLSDENNWQYSFTNLEKVKDGQEIQYTLTEDTIPGYSTELTGDGASGYRNVFINTKIKVNPISSGNVGSLGNPLDNSKLGSGDKNKNSNSEQSLAKKKEKSEVSSVLGISRDADSKKEEENKSTGSNGEVLSAERDTKTGDQSKSLQYLFFFTAAGFGLFAFFYKEKKKSEIKK